jgi:uncharacterized protein GlcG (DUF336 family)
MSIFPLADAVTIIDAALEDARARGLNPLAVIVLDSGGHPVALKREDGAPLLRWRIANAKAWGVLGVGFGGREIARRAVSNPHFVTAASELSGGNIVPVPGGVLIRDGKGEIIGSVGVSGDKSELDEAVAVAGILAAGYVPDTGDPT